MGKRLASRILMVPIIANHIEATPGVCGGRPKIAGHRIRVQDVVVWHEQLGQSPDEIVSDHPEISLADVYAALAYYHDHRQEIRQQMELDGDLATSLQGKTQSKLLRKLTRDNAGVDSVSSG